MATSLFGFDVVKNCLNYSIQDSPNAVSMSTLILSNGKCSKCLPAFMPLSQPLSKTRDSFDDWTCGKMFNIFFSATFNSETVLASDEAFKKGLCIAPQTCIIRLFKNCQPQLKTCKAVVIVKIVIRLK